MVSNKHAGQSPYAILAKRADFVSARSGINQVGRFMRLQVLRRDLSEDFASRVGITVTKKNGNSVVRNRIKRRLREAVRQCGAGELRPQHDYVIISKPRAVDVEFAALCDDMLMTIRRAHAKSERNDEQRCI